jgi:hypothetical protein
MKLNVKFESPSSEILPRLNTSCLKRIVLINNGWGIIPNGMFHSLSRIKHIDLTGNKLQILNCTEFVGLHALYFLTVRLSDNDTSEEVLNANSCIVLTWLPASSKLRSFNNNNSEKPKKLKQLNLDITRLYHLPKGVFLHLKYLEKLVLFGNRITGCWRTTSGHKHSKRYFSTSL